MKTVMLIKKFVGLLSIMVLVTLTGFGRALVAASPGVFPSGVVSTPYSASFTATGGSAPYSWALTGCSGACNTGLGFNASGVLSGTPANAGTSTFAVKVTDAN